MSQERVWMMGAVLTTSLIGGAIGGMLVETRVSAQGSAEVVTASQLNLVDRDGRLRGVMAGSDERGLASLAFYDESGQVRSVFGIRPDGTPVLRLSDAQGQRRVLVTAEGDEAFVMVGGDNERQGFFGIVQGSPMVSLSDGTRSRAQLHLSPAGLPRLALSDGDGEQTAALSVDNHDMPQLMLSAGGRPRAIVGVVADSTVLNLSDSTQPRLVFGVADNGRPSVNFLDENGDVVTELP